MNRFELSNKENSIAPYVIKIYVKEDIITTFSQHQKAQKSDIEYPQQHTVKVTR